MNHWMFVEDTFYVKGLGLVLTAGCLPHEFNAGAGWPVTIFSPNGVVISTRIKSVKNFTTLLDSNNRFGVGLLVNGFYEKVIMDGWLVCVHEI